MLNSHNECFLYFFFIYTGLSILYYLKIDELVIKILLKAYLLKFMNPENMTESVI